MLRGVVGTKIAISTHGVPLLLNRLTGVHESVTVELVVAGLTFVVGGVLEDRFQCAERRIRVRLFGERRNCRDRGCGHARAGRP